MYSKPKIAAAFALGFIAGSSRWLWISILLSGVLHFIATFDFSLNLAAALPDPVAFGVGLVFGGMTAAGIMVPHTQSTGPK